MKKTTPGSTPHFAEERGSPGEHPREDDLAISEVDLSFNTFPQDRSERLVLCFDVTFNLCRSSLTVFSCFLQMFLRLDRFPQQIGDG